jgi:hypothetical protein
MILIPINFSDFLSRLESISSFLGLATELKTLGLQVAILLFLISLLVNLLQRRYSKARFNRMLAKEESVLNFLVDTRKDLGNLEWNCTVEMNGATSPQELGKGIHVARNNIESTIADMSEHLHSFRQYRKKQKVLEKQRKLSEKSPQRPSGQYRLPA